MSKEKKVVELNDKELEKVSGGGSRRPLSCSRGSTWCNVNCTKPSWCDCIVPEGGSSTYNVCGLGIPGGFNHSNDAHQN